MCRRAAARPMFCSSATAMKYLRWRRSMGNYLMLGSKMERPGASLKYRAVHVSATGYGIGLTTCGKRQLVRVSTLPVCLEASSIWVAGIAHSCRGRAIRGDCFSQSRILIFPDLRSDHRGVYVRFAILSRYRGPCPMVLDIKDCAAICCRQFQGNQSG